MIDDTAGGPEGLDPIRGQDAWARLRFSIVGGLLAAPPARGELQAELARLAAKTWRHPITGEPATFGRSTIERWYYEARNAGQDPVGALRRRLRKDAGRQASISAKLETVVRALYADHPSWSHQLHYDNLEVLVAEDPGLERLPSYSTIRRYMKAHGLLRQRGRRRGRDGVSSEPREVRSYEVEYVHGLWHADFHDGSRHVLVRTGEWRQPYLLATVDDRSRLCCHAQWYLDVEAESFVHGLCQAFQKRGLPRALMTDRGSAMRAGETQSGLLKLGVVWQPTLPYSPHQNAKQETFWNGVEGRLMAMLEGEDELTLDLLNEATQAWVELEYNRETHSEIGTAPLRRFLEDDKQVGRECPSSEVLRDVFRIEITRTQRRSDGTIPLLGQRFELPSSLRHFERVCLRLARWDLSFVHVVDPVTGTPIARIYPLDKHKNADALRACIAPDPEAPAPSTGRPGRAPLLRKLMAEYAATGIPPAYLPKHNDDDDEGASR